MATNYIKTSRGGSDLWNGYKCFRVYHDGYGELFEGGARYVVFDEGRLVAEVSNPTDADRAFKLGAFIENGVRLENYIGIDEKLR